MTAGRSGRADTPERHHLTVSYGVRFCSEVDAERARDALRSAGFEVEDPEFGRRRRERVAELVRRDGRELEWGPDAAIVDASIEVPSAPPFAAVGSEEWEAARDAALDQTGARLDAVLAGISHDPQITWQVSQLESDDRRP